jgi:hypothetical protein
MHKDYEMSILFVKTEKVLKLIIVLTFIVKSSLKEETSGLPNLKGFVDFFYGLVIYEGL